MSSWQLVFPSINICHSRHGSRRRQGWRELWRGGRLDRLLCEQVHESKFSDLGFSCSRIRVSRSSYLEAEDLIGSRVSAWQATIFADICSHANTMSFRTKSCRRSEHSSAARISYPLLTLFEEKRGYQGCTCSTWGDMLF